ncbi:glycerate kinase type-2 family protein [Candidatus Hodarchaeum mangrovi]
MEKGNQKMIKNQNELLSFARSENTRIRREILLNLYESALVAVNPLNIIQNNIVITHDQNELQIFEKSIKIRNRKIWIIGGGKAVGHMAQALEEILQNCELSGIVIVPKGVKSQLKLKNIECLESEHPIPSFKNIENTEALLEVIKKIKKEDLVLALISGGGSALLTAPIDTISWNDFQRFNLLLITNKMTIQQINIIRKHISNIKGGRLATYCKSNEILVFVISDVIGDDLTSIASGPFYPDPSTFKDAKQILQEFNLWENSTPFSIKEHIQKGIKSLVKETPKPYDPIFQNISHFILASNKIACNFVIDEATRLGIRYKFLTNQLEGNFKDMVEYLFKEFTEFLSKGENSCLFISGGEPTIEVTGKGIGGRNQEVAALMLLKFKEFRGKFCFLSAGTDGIDGNSPYAGAIVDTDSLIILEQSGLIIENYQLNNDLTTFFSVLGGSLIKTGPTGTNVMDIHFCWIEKS